MAFTCVALRSGINKSVIRQDFPIMEATVKNLWTKKNKLICLDY